MKRNVQKWVVGAVVLAGATGCSEQKVPSSTGQQGSSSVPAALSAGSVASDDSTAVALARALDDEYKARATYRATIEKLGEVRPFINIVEAEQRHIDRVLALYSQLGLNPPGDQWAGKVTAPATLGAACTAGIEAEVENVALYDDLLEQVKEAEVRLVLEQLQSASRDRHLPAFRRCVGRVGRL